MECSRLPSSGTLSSKANAFSVKSLIANKQVKEVHSLQRQDNGQTDNQVFCEGFDQAPTVAGTRLSL